MTEYLVFVHGIGRQSPGFSSGFFERIRSAYNRAVVSAGRPRPVQDALVPTEAYWHEVTEADQDRLWEQLGLRGFARRLPWNLLRSYLLDFVGDEIAYASLTNRPPHKYGAITGRVEAAIETMAREARARGESNAPLTVIAHSLGTVIASDAIYDMQRDGRFPDVLHFENFFTMGSPMALYALRYGIDAFDRPIRPHHWINFLYPQDSVGYPLRTINAAYREAVDEDIRLTVGGSSFSVRSELLRLLSWTPLFGSLFTHLWYGHDRVVIGRIASTLAAGGDAGAATP